MHDELSCFFVANLSRGWLFFHGFFARFFKEGLKLNYINGKDVIPSNLLEQIQKYIQGEIIYIPKKENNRAKWGEKSGTREYIKKRNEDIFRLYKGGTSVYELMVSYNLSEDSIRKIIFKKASSYD